MTTNLASPISWLVDVGARVSLVIVLLLISRPLLRRVAGNRAAPWLWWIIAVRLLAPVPVQLPWRFLPGPALQREFPAAVARVFLEPGHRLDDADQTVAVGAVAAPALAQGLNPWSVLWLAGTAIALANLAGRWLQTRRWGKHTVPVEECARVAQIFAAIPAAQRRGVTVRLTDALDVPALVGVLRPQIWLPRAGLAGLATPELRHILLHELGHARRGDLLAQWAWSLACCVHWFNPLVWLAARAARTDRELACDAWVLARGDEDLAAEYGRTLIKVVRRLPSRRLPWAVAASMAAGAGNLGLRVREISAFQRRAPIRGLAAAGLAAAMVAALTVSGAAPLPSPPPAPEPPQAPQPPQEPRAGGTQLLFVSQLVAISPAAMEQLRRERASFPGAEKVIDQLTTIFAGKASAASPPTMLNAFGDYKNLLRRLQTMEGVDFIAAPRVTTKPKQNATIEIVRELRFPVEFSDDKLPGFSATRTPTKFETRNLGFTLELEGEIKPDLVALKVDWKLVDLQGYANPKDQKPMNVDPAAPGDAQPVIDTHSVGATVEVPPGATLVLSANRPRPVLWSVFNNVGGASSNAAVVLNFITVDVMGAAPKVANLSADQFIAAMPASNTTEVLKSTAAPDASPTPGKLEYGIPVEGKPGFVKSPYAPDSGFVDLQGYKRDQEVRDPYTGRIFLVP